MWTQPKLFMIIMFVIVVVVVDEDDVVWLINHCMLQNDYQIFTFLNIGLLSWLSGENT